MVMVAPLYYSAEMVRALPDDGKRYETVHGELLVTPAPRLWHQEVVARMFFELREFAKHTNTGHVFQSPADISWGPDTLVQPDLFVADLEQVRTLDWANVKTLLLAIEVLSPSTARHDRFTKRRLYQEVGIPLYWIVDPDKKVVEVWTPDSHFPVFEREAIEWRPEGAGEAFIVELEELFEPI